MINILLYTGLGLVFGAATLLTYGMATTYMEQHRLVDNKAVKPQNVKVTQ